MATQKEIIKKYIQTFKDIKTWTIDDVNEEIVNNNLSDNEIIEEYEEIIRQVNHLIDVALGQAVYDNLDEEIMADIAEKENTRNVPIEPLARAQYIISRIKTDVERYRACRDYNLKHGVDIKQRGIKYEYRLAKQEYRDIAKDYKYIIEKLNGELKKHIVFPSKYNREINLGVIESDYYFDLNAKMYNHRRKVKWLKHLPRTAFSQGALYEVGAFTTCFEIKNYTDEFLQALDKDFKTQKAESIIDETIERTAADIQNNTCDFILKELSRKQKGYDLEDFVADLLRAMGYRATVSPKGGDGGVDITAYKDELPPRILVQVKSQDGDIKEATIQSLKGAMKEGDYGLFVTLSNYTANALKYLESTPIIRGINGEELANLILKYYDKLPDRCKKIVPLSAVYIPDIKTE